MKQLLKTLSLLLYLAFLSQSRAAELKVEEQELWTSGKDGYHTYRIPSLLVTPKGTVLAFCEGRKTAGGDHGDLDLLVKRSTDGGRTWSAQAIVYEEGDTAKITIGNPCPVVDRSTGTIWLPFCRDNKHVLLTHSDDEGVTWSEPRDLTREAVGKDWVWVATGPGVGIQLEQGPHEGRLVIPCDHRKTLGDKTSEWNSHMMYSDDHGKTWRISGPIQAGGNECQIVELKDGTILVNTRMQGGFEGMRGLATSTDGGASFTTIRHEKQLPCPKCQGGMIRLASTDAKSPGLILVSNPFPIPSTDGKPASSRIRLTLRTSADDGKTWSAGRELYPHKAAYSSPAQLADGTILCLYEGGEKSAYSALRLARFSPDWLTETEADVCIYGGTSGGVAAAVQAARMGKRAILLEPGKHLGGMTSGGLSAVDIGDPRSVGGFAREYFTKLVARYGKTLQWDQPFKGNGGPATGGAYAIEPHTAEQLFDELAKEAGVQVFREARIERVEKQGTRILGISTDDGRRFTAKMFIDATYEGDLMAAAGVSYTLEREGNAKYGETYNGIYYDPKYEPRTNHKKPGANGRVPGGQGVWDRDFPLDPYVVPGDPQSGLLPLLQAGDPGQPGEPADGVQAYCFRLCLTTADDRLPITSPADYNPKRYELVARFVKASQEIGDDVDLRWFSKYDPLPNQKWDFNTATFGGNLPGASHAWPEASYAKRREIAREHENYHRGLLHFLATDERVPQKVRDEMRRFGLPRDEFQDNGGWPHQIYVREGRRMVSDLVLTEHHTFGRQVAPHSIALGSYGTDTHEIRRIVKDGVVIREGKTAGGRGGFGPYQIGYGAIVPRAAECENLFVTFALSASHTAFSSIRMEPVLMCTSQSAATAAALAIDVGVPVQKVDYEQLRSRLEKDGQILEWNKAVQAAK
jgi:hypothetical protein